MRVISGKFKSRKLKSPAKGDKRVRPTTDRTRETLFNVLENTLDFKDKICCDLFCGTGSLGIECLSRGAAKCFFVDKNTRLVSENIKTLGLEMQSEIITEDALKFISSGRLMHPDLALCDPPYGFENYESLLNYLSQKSCITVIEHSKDMPIDFSYNGYIIKEKKIGISAFTIFKFEQ